MNNIKYICLLILSLLIINISHAQEETSKTNKLYVKLGVGLGVLNLAEQPLLKSYKMPFLVRFEIGNHLNNLSYFADYEINNEYKQDFVALKINTLSLGVKYKLNNIIGVSEDRKYEIYLAAAPTYWMADLYYIENPNYYESDKGFGAKIVAGFNYDFNNLILGLALQYTSSITNGAYYAGTYEEQSTKTGGFQTQIQLNYVFN